MGVFVWQHVFFLLLLLSNVSEFVRSYSPILVFELSSFQLDARPANIKVDTRKKKV